MHLSIVNLRIPGLTGRLGTQFRYCKKGRVFQHSWCRWISLLILGGWERSYKFLKDAVIEPPVYSYWRRPLSLFSVEDLFSWRKNRTIQHSQALLNVKILQLFSQLVTWRARLRDAKPRVGSSITLMCINESEHKRIHCLIFWLAPPSERIHSDKMSRAVPDFFGLITYLATNSAKLVFRSRQFKDKIAA